MTWKFAILVWACTIALYANQALNGQVFDWNTTSSTWHTSSAWSPAGPPTAAGTAQFQIDIADIVDWQDSTGDQSIARLFVLAGDYTLDGSSASTRYTLSLGNSIPALMVDGSGTQLSMKDLAIDARSGSASIQNGGSLHLDGTGKGAILIADSLTSVGTMSLENIAVAAVSQHVQLGNGSGTPSLLSISSGSFLENWNANIGVSGGSTAVVNISGTQSGTNSAWISYGNVVVENGNMNIGPDAVVAIGDDIIPGGPTMSISNLGSNATAGNLSISNASLVNNDGSSAIGSSNNAFGDVTVQDVGAQWNNTGDLSIGSFGVGSMHVLSGGSVTNTNGFVGAFASASGTVEVNGNGSSWSSSNDLHVGVNGTGVLNIENDGLVSVGGTTMLGNYGAINLNGGHFEFGRMTWEEFGEIVANIGSLTGGLLQSANTHADTLPKYASGVVDYSGLHIENSGTLYGDANLEFSLHNTSSGEVDVISGERMQFSGWANNQGEVNSHGGQFRFEQSSLNSGEINNYGGQILFGQDVVNDSSGFINGRGQFSADDGWVNEGVMAFSGGTADILGDVVNQSSGLIVTTGMGTTTFYDDVTHNGSEIRTSAGASTVFLGAATGSSNFTGTGPVFFEGDLRPGNSPGIVSFEGDVVFGVNFSLDIELQGYGDGEFDRLEIGGDLVLDGNLNVDTLSNFDLGWNKRFVIVDVGGQVEGSFSNLAEGDLVGNFGGVDLFLSYQGGDGNDVTLVSAVPEPGFGSLIVLMSGLLFSRWRRIRHRSRI